ncbi:hypothetical protein AMJ48_02430 [Parcubacteria bacterium DG_74_1]|nr:MAG: hypothetical protein AMJ48_02430 [Parcubacteria bacterium DG_74_1]
MAFDIETINRLIVLFINAFGIFLGAWVLFANRKAALNRRFTLMTIAGLLWVNSAYLGFSSKDVSTAVALYKLNGISALLTALTFYYFFILSFLKEEEKHSLLNKIILLVIFLLICLTGFTDLVVKDVRWKEFGMEIIHGEYGGIAYYLFAFFFILLMAVWLIRKYFVLSIQEKQKTQYFFIGIILWMFFNIVFNTLIPLIFNTARYQHFGDYSIIFLLGFTAYAIVRRQLFGIKVLLTALLVVLIAILLLLNTLLFTENTPFQILNGIIFIVFLFFGYYLIKSVQTEIKRREELEELTSRLERVNVELATAYKKLERLDKAKTEFLSIASHQLRTPLTAVKGYISMMLEKIYGKPPKKMIKPLENIYASNERLIRLINSLLNISRIETGKIEMNLEKVSLEKLINDIFGDLKQAVEGKDIFLELKKTKEPLPEISVDKDKIRQAIMNILDNAIKYTERGGVTVKLKAVKQKLQIIISDTGEGMTGDEISNLFVSFTRGKAGVRMWTEGAGLGLYIAKKFAEMHNGKVWAESPGKGRGSTFYIELPIK